MSRRIGEDFNAFVEFLSEYNLTSYTSVPQQVEACKGMHKKLFGLLVFNAEFKVQGNHSGLGRFSRRNGLRSAAFPVLRCSGTVQASQTSTPLQHGEFFEISDND